jgi:hypothetical protein
VTVVESSQTSEVEDEDVLVDLLVDLLVEDVLVDVEVWHPVAVTTAQLVSQPRPLHCSWHGKDV